MVSRVSQAGLVGNRLGTAYGDVETVAAYIAEIKRVADSIAIISQMSEALPVFAKLTEEAPGLLIAARGVEASEDNVNKTLTSIQELALSVSVVAERIANVQAKALETLNTFKQGFIGAVHELPADALIGAMALHVVGSNSFIVIKKPEGWRELTTVLLGGVRHIDYPKENREAEQLFRVEGNFTTGDIFLNGVQLRKGVDYQEEEDGSGFKLGLPTSTTDDVSFRGYKTDVTSNFVHQSELALVEARLLEKIEALQT